MNDKINIEDEIKVFFSSHPPISGTIKYMPQATGDAFHITTNDGYVVFVQQYDYIIKLSPNVELVDGARTMTVEQNKPRFCALPSNDGLDAARYRRLAWLVEFGEWSVCKHVIKDSYGLTDDTYMDDKADMDAWLDKPEVVTDADDCAKALHAAY